MRILTEKEAEDFLESAGFNVVKRAFAKSKEDLKKLSSKIEFPWVIKISSKHIVHKAKLGGTILNISSISQAEKAFTKLQKIKNFEGVLVQKMEKGDELIFGLKKTPEFGQVLMIGTGGSKVEEKKDVSFRIIPIKEADAEEMLRELKICQKLKNTQAIKENLLKLSTLASKNQNIEELDVNPMIVNSKQAIVVDARAILS